MARRVTINLNQRARGSRGRGRGGRGALNIKEQRSEQRAEPQNETNSSPNPMTTPISTKRTIEEIEVEEVYGSELKNIMGITSFDSTKNKHVKGTDCYAIKFNQKTEYRQYMNREKGFNRELSPTRLDKKKIKLNLRKKQTKKSKKES